MEQIRDISRQKPLSSRGQTGPKLGRDVDPVGQKDFSNRRKCPDCDGRISKETKSKSRVWKKVMWFTRRSKTAKNDICQCQTESFSNNEDRHSNSWSFTRSASRKFRISSRRRQCKSESSKQSVCVRGKHDEACTSQESSLPSMSTGSVSSSGANSPTATGSFCDFGVTSHVGARGSKGHKNTFVLTEIARAINPPVKNDVSSVSKVNQAPKQLSKSSSSVSHISRRTQSPIASNVRRSKSFPGSQSSISPSKRRLTNMPNKTFASFSPPLKQKCYGLRRTATFCGKLNMEFPKICLKKSKSVNAVEFMKLEKATSLGEIRDQSGSIVGIVHFYKSPKKLATRRMSSSDREIKSDSVFEEEESLYNEVQRSSLSIISLQNLPPSESKTVDIDPVGMCIEPDTRPLSSCQLSIEALKDSAHDMKCRTIACASSMPEILAEGQECCASINESLKGTAKIIKESNSKDESSTCCTSLSELDGTMNISKFKTVSEAVELSCCHDDQISDGYHNHGNHLLVEPLSTSITCDQSSEYVKLPCHADNYLLLTEQQCMSVQTCQGSEILEKIVETESGQVSINANKLCTDKQTESVTNCYNGIVNSDFESDFDVLSVGDTSFSEGLEDSIYRNDACQSSTSITHSDKFLDNETEITEQFKSLTASDDQNFEFPDNKAKLSHSTTDNYAITDTSSDLASLEVFDTSISVSKPKSDLALEVFDTPSSSIKSVSEPASENNSALEIFDTLSSGIKPVSKPKSDFTLDVFDTLSSNSKSVSELGQGDVFEECENDLRFCPQKCDNLAKIATPTVSDEEFQRCVHSSPETLECSRTSDYMSMLDESQQHVPIHTWKTSESLDMKSDEIGLPVPGQTFKMRTELMLSWFEEFNDEQRNIILKKILNRCELPQMHLLSVAMENNLHKTCPPNCQDMLVWLPYTVTLKILMYLDAGSLCRCNQVNRAWNELADNPLLWQRLTRNPDYQLSEASSKIQYQKFTQANGEIYWKKVFAERFLLHKNWLNGKYKLRTFEGHNQGIACVQFDDTRIVSGSSDKTIKLWDISNTPSELMLTLEGHSGTVRCLDLNGNRLVSGSTDRTIKVWDLSFASYWAGASCKVTMVGHLHTVRCLQADEKKLVSGSYDKTVKVWDLKTGECRLTLRGHTAAVLCVQFDDQKIVSGSYDKKIKVWDLTEGTCLMTLDGHQDAVTCLNLTHDGMKIITGSLDYSLKFWDLSTGKCYGTLDWITSEGHTAVVRCLQVDSWRIVSGGDDKTLKVWELATGQRLLTLRYHSDGVTCMQFNDFAIVSGSYDRTVKLWDFTPKHPYLEAIT